MTYEIYRYVFFGALAACLLMVILSVVLFFVLHIPRVINDLTGRTAKRAIENIRNQNYTAGEKHKASGTGRRRQVTDKISASGQFKGSYGKPAGSRSMTEKIDCQQPPVSEGSFETTVLNQSGEQNATTVLDVTMPGPTQGETTVLQPQPAEELQFNNVQQFFVEYEITYVHTDEVIPQEVFAP